MASKLLTVLLLSILALTFVSSAIIRVAKVEDDEYMTNIKEDAVEIQIEEQATESESETESYTMSESMSEMESMMESVMESPSESQTESTTESASETSSETATASESASASAAETPSETASETNSLDPTNTETQSAAPASLSQSETPTRAPSTTNTETHTAPPSTSETPTKVPVGGAQVAAKMSVETTKSAAEFKANPSAVKALEKAISDLVKFVVAITSITDKTNKAGGVNVDYVMYIPANVDLAKVFSDIAAIPPSSFTASMNTELAKVDSTFVITGASAPTLEVVPPEGQSNTFTLSATYTVTETAKPPLPSSASTPPNPSASKPASSKPASSNSLAPSATPTKPREEPTSSSYAVTVVISVVSVFLFSVFAY